MNVLDSSVLERAVASQSSAVAASRRAAFDVFEKLDMPSSSEEVWRYVDLDFDLADYAAADEGPAAGDDDPLRPLFGDVSGVARIVDGYGVVEQGPALSGLHIASLRSLAEPAASAVAAAFDGGVPSDLDIFSAAHGAFSPDAIVVHTAAGATVREPVYIDVQAAATGSVSFPHVIVDAGESSQLSVVVGYRSAADLDALVVPRLEIAASANAIVNVTVVQDWGAATKAISHAAAIAGNDANVTLAEAGLGGALSRLHLSVDLIGKGSHADVLGAYFGEHEQVLDYRYFMRHVGESTTSNMFLKGGVEDEALSVFTGMIRIEESAQRTDAFQTNRNLLLSDGASAQSVPNLEILANDVRCGHGSTVGPLDPGQRYYLMSRGLGPRRADRLQVRGFFADALSRFPQAEVAVPVQAAIDEKYAVAQQEGRV